ncbi:hypothetical protein [Metamycoplasma neophronis]|uniref:DUF1292 domain-containing protein n=1 Tax=Metamycoplasma neophronis TaxID=872983 RepID=A0ABY2Z0F8_9BACT|nr:hypothetical protein [Metamycoplasma neophronis]TPR54367.1 hypothetical protein FJR74_01160 [Metamycoplasma neophronis]
MERKVVNIFTPEREIIVDDNEKLYVLFQIEENGELYFCLTNGEALMFAKDVNGELSEVDDEGELDILVDLVAEYAENNLVLDRDGKSDLLAKLIGEEVDE